MLSTITKKVGRWRSRKSNEVSWTIEHPAVAAVAERAREHRHLDSAGLIAATADLRELLSKPENRDLQTQIEACSLAMEALRRTKNIELFETQRLAGLVLIQGMVAQMQTGEGKTFSASLPALYGALLGEGVHVMTSNAYLAERDADIARPAFDLLGVSVGFLEPNADDRSRQQAYRCDVTYGAGYEFGFDYLRDQMSLIQQSSRGLGSEFENLLKGSKISGPVLRQRGLACAVIDEVDSILLDEATVPLLLSGAGEGGKEDERPYRLAGQLAEQLCEGRDFELDHSRRQARLTEQGRFSISPSQTQLSGVKLDRPWHDYVEKALVATHLLQRDVQYVVINNKVVLVDEFTGRLQADRSWKDGLHQAVETKERLALSAKNRTLAQTSRQRLLRRYKMLCGMTGTAIGSENEFRDSYGMEVVQIPTHHPSKRQYLPDRFFVDTNTKWRAAVNEITALHQQGRPVLIGSRTIQASEAVARMLTEAGIPYQVLNGKQTADEAELVARAGHRGMVTVATNMAGRGTDIRLGPGVAELGGVHMLGLERHTSPRIDGQLAGRVARQGDPGSCQFFVSSDDMLVQEFAPGLGHQMVSLADYDGEIYADLSPRIQKAQEAAEDVARKQRQQIKDQDKWMDETVKLLYGGG